MSVVRDELRCMLDTLVLVARRQILLPTENVGRRISFLDGSSSVVYRETAMRKRPSGGLVLIVVRFRLRFIGSSRLGHWLFRLESLLNTLLFAAHRGFQSKLWLTDRDTWFYRGIYEWEGREAAVEYAETVRVVLRPWVEDGTFAYRVIEGASREHFLEGTTVAVRDPSGDCWWRPTVRADAPASSSFRCAEKAPSDARKRVPDAAR